MSNDDLHPAGSGPEPNPTKRSPYSVHGAPAPLATAAALTLLQGLLTGILGFTEALSVDSDRIVMGVTTAVFFLGCGAALIACAWGMSTLRQWARGPVLLVQLITLGLAWNFRTGDTLPIAIGLAVIAATVLAGLLHPRSIHALERADRQG